MKIEIILLITTTIGLSVQYGQRPQYEPQPEWPSEPEPEWRPPAPEWRPPAPEWQPIPKPENRCKVIPKKAHNVEFTPIAETNCITNSVYPCAEGSAIRQLEYHNDEQVKLTCNGVIVYKGDYNYEAVWNSHSHGGGKHKDVLNLVNYTVVSSYNNGNTDYTECGTIIGGRCSGDTLWGTAIYQANDQNGCCKGGVDGFTAVFRQIEIRGKCASKCSLGSSVQQINPPINNHGIADRTAVSVDNELDD